MRKIYQTPQGGPTEIAAEMPGCAELNGARPSDIRLPDGWTWDRVEQQRAKWGLEDNLIPVATAPGCVAWATINSQRSAGVAP